MRTPIENRLDAQRGGEEPPLIGPLLSNRDTLESLSDTPSPGGDGLAPIFARVALQGGTIAARYTR